MDKERQEFIAKGLRRGERQAWLGLYDAYAERVWKYVSRLMGGDSGAVGDVVQETFMAAARSAQGYDPGRGSLWMWLVGISRNQIALYRRKHGTKTGAADARRWLVSLDGIKGELIDEGVELPVDVLESKELAVLVREALGNLPSEYHTLLLSVYVDGEDVNRIAGEMNCSVVAVRSKLARARKAFRKVFRKLTRSVSSAREE